MRHIHKVAADTREVHCIGCNKDRILYVNKTATGSNDGSSWADAIPELSDALLTAKTLNENSPGAVEQIWVAKGTYVPRYNAADNTNGDGGRDNAFVLLKDVRLYGGFRGDETDTTARDLTDESNRTILSGDLDENDEEDLTIIGDNAYHVVISAGDVGTASLNGFTIQGGMANFDGAVSVNSAFVLRINGGGVSIVNSSPAFTNVIVRGNGAGSHGGGIHNDFSFPVFLNLTVTGNLAGMGGGICNMSSSPVLSNAIIWGNEAVTGGGILYRNSTGTLTNVTISQNIAVFGAEYLSLAELAEDPFSHPTPIIRNSIIWGNGVAGDLYDVENSLVQGQEDNNTYGDSNLPSDTNPLFTDPGNGDFTLQALSPAINAGNNSFFPGLTNDTEDLAGNFRIQGSAIDMGAYEFQPSPFVPDGNGVLFVNKVATGSGDGSSWANAIPELSDALLAASRLNKGNSGTVQQIWVARGTYVPLYNAVDNTAGDGGRDNAFVLLENVMIYGGFKGDGSESAITDRNLADAGNRTILSGDLDGNDGDNFIGNSENTYHVVVGRDMKNMDSWEWESMINTGLDGFTITGGNADGTNLLLETGDEINRDSGAGIFLSHADVMMTNLVITGNTASFHGGGVYSYTSTSKFTNVLITGNTATHHGGGFWNNSGGKLLNVTITGNIAGDGGEVFNDGATIEIRNSIVWGNGIDQYNESSFYVENSLVQYDRINGSNNLPIDTDPQFKDPANGDYSLAPGSPAINTGDGAHFRGLNAASKDLVGNPRVSGPAIDMGAYEFQQITAVPDANGVLYVNKAATGNNNGSSWVNAILELSDALLAAKTLNTATAGTVQQIWVAKGTYVPLYNADDNATGDGGRDNAFVLLKDVRLYGGFRGDETDTSARDLTDEANRTILSGDLDENDGEDLTINGNNAYHVVISSGDVGNASLNGFTIQGGGANGSGGVSVNNTAPFRDYGGGIYIESSSPVFTNMVVRGNRAATGGGVLCAYSSPVFSNVIITKNEASNEGGGVFSYSFDSSGHYINMTISQNSAGTGAEWRNGSGTPVIRNSIMWGNGVLGELYDVENSLVQGQEGNANYTNAGTNLPTDTNPAFTNPENGDLTLQASSPAVNAGDNSFFTGLDNDSKDVAGNFRLRGTHIDMGAFEYQSQQFTVSFNKGSGGVTDTQVWENEKITEPANPAQTSYIFAGWFKEEGLTNAWDFDNEVVTGNMTLYAKWTPVVFTVTFSSNGGTTVSPVNVFYNATLTAPANPTRTGYDFAGWFKEEGLTNAWDFGSDVVTDNMTLYAKWTPVVFTVTFSSNGGTTASPVNVSYNATLTAPADPTRTGYDFAGWFKEEALTNAWDFDNDVVTASITLYAKWISGILYVNAAGALPLNQQDGTTWQTAYSSLHDALAAAAAGPQKEIWVAGGTYITNPLADSPATRDQRKVYFKIPDGVALYGGFTGNETTRDERDFYTNLTVLSGEIGATGPSDNSFHVLLFDETGDQTILDGFVVQDGNANQGNIKDIIPHSIPLAVNENGLEEDNSEIGGGIALINGASPYVRNSKFERNNGVFGGGAYISVGCSPVFENCYFRGNQSNFGGGVYGLNMTAGFVNVVFSGNYALGGALYLNQSSPDFTNVTIASNGSSDGDSKAVYTYQSSPVFRNSIIWGNFGGSITTGATISFSIIQGGHAGTSNQDASPNFINLLHYGLSPSLGGDYRVSASSLAVDGGAEDATGLPDVDLDGNPRVRNGRIDMGAFENPNAALPVTLVRFDARLQENYVQLTWQTTREENFSHFELQRSRDGKNFARIAEQTPLAGVAGSKNYAYSDYLTGLQGAASLLYYRLKMIDNDGTFAYSNIESVEWKDGYSAARQIALYPNPAQKWLSVSGVTSGDILEVVLLNASGIELFRTGKPSGPIDVSGFSSGVYLVSIRFSDGTLEICKVIVDR